MSDFPSVAFQTSLTIIGILFGIVGFLFPIYASYMESITPASGLKPPPIVAITKRAVRAVIALVILNASINIYSLVLMTPSGLTNIILSIMCGMSVLAMTILIVIWVFRYME